MFPSTVNLTPRLSVLVFQHLIFRIDQVSAHAHCLDKNANLKNELVYP